MLWVFVCRDFKIGNLMERFNGVGVFRIERVRSGRVVVVIRYMGVVVRSNIIRLGNG